MAEETSNLFRKKTVESIESPEEMHDYLRVTSPGIWLFLIAVILLLVGVVVWGILGRINTTVPVAVVSQDGACVCVAPYEKLEDIMDTGYITVDDTLLSLKGTIDEPFTVSGDTNVQIRLAGDFEMGDIVAALPLNASLEPGVYEGTVITESLRPASLLLN